MLACLVLLFQTISAQKTQYRDTSQGYDSLLAVKTGADKMGMKSYIFCYLKKGPNRSHSKEEARTIQAGHMANIQRLADSGYLILAGPFMDTGAVRGIFIFNTSDMEQARRWTAADPAVVSGRLEMELHPWYGSAALVLLNDLHRRISKEED